MAKSNLEARILVCDPHNRILPDLVKILHRRFGEGEPPLSTDTVRRANLAREARDTTWFRDRSEEMIADRLLAHTYSVEFGLGRVEISLVDDLSNIPSAVLTQAAPYYALIVYEAEEMKQEGSGRIITAVKKRDPMMPQMIWGGGLGQETTSHFVRAGVLNFTDTPEIADDQIKKIFREPTRIPFGTVVKIGGSAFDYDGQCQGANLQDVCDTLVDIHADKHTRPGKQDTVNRIIVTVGAGQYGDIVKARAAKYPENKRTQERFPLAMAGALNENLRAIEEFFREPDNSEIDVAALLNTGAFYFIDRKSTAKKIPLIGTAPHYVMARDGIPLQDSDTHTIALAEHYHIPRIVLIKRTDGIYDYDPMRGCVLDPVSGRCKDLDRWLETQRVRGNRRHSIVTIDELLGGGIRRSGTGPDGASDRSRGHLMEDSALRYMRGCQHVQEIVVVHIAPEELHFPIGENRYEHLITGEIVELDPKTGWSGYLKNSIQDAFHGVAKSKIVRE